MFPSDAAKVKSFSTASRAKATVITVQIECFEAYELGNILRQLHEAQHPVSKPKSGMRGRQGHVVIDEYAGLSFGGDRPRLPSPNLALPYHGDGE